MQLGVLASVDFDLSESPIDDPVLDHTAPRVELKLRFTVAAFIEESGGEHFDDKLRSSVEFSIRFQCCGQAGVAYPNEIRRDVVILIEDQAGGARNQPCLRRFVPFPESR